MYERFYELAVRPFDLNSAPEFLYLSEAHREALSNLRFGIESGRGVTVLTGEAGTGKTTLIRRTISDADGLRIYAHVTNPRLTRDEFFAYLCRGFNLGARAEASKTAFLTALEEDAVDRMERGGHTVLIVDEAQVAPDEILEEVRLLTNMEVPGGRSPLLSILLVGQPEFGERLSSVALQNLKQRVALRCELRPLTLQETAGFIASRIRAAGGIPVNVFSREAVQMIHDVSSGIPRMICVLCDNALINGLAANERPVGSSRVAEVCRDFHLAFVTSSHDPPSRTAARVLVPQPDDEGRERPARAETASVAPATSPEAATSDRPLFGSFGRHRRTGSFRGAS